MDLNDYRKQIDDIDRQLLALFGQRMEVAAAIAAYHSKARTSENVPVDYVPVRNVKKPAGAKPGMVIFTGSRWGREWGFSWGLLRLSLRWAGFCSGSSSACAVSSGSLCSCSSSGSCWGC